MENSGRTKIVNQNLNYFDVNVDITKKRYLFKMKQ